MFTQPPHIYFTGNMEEYADDLLVNNNSGQTNYLKLLSLPSFAKTHSVVLMDLATWESYEVVFDM